MEPTPCRICNTLAFGALCKECNVALGIVTEPGQSRPNKPCHRCEGTSFIRAQAREFTRQPGQHGPQATYPMGVTSSVELSRAVFSRQVTARGAAASQPFGILDMYVCRRCGLTEWFCRDPENIPVGPEFTTEIIDVDPSSPYR